ncbi:hypothetical protein C0991_010672 [Blastosporella zonata]|nr:hypothetical protein C0991_010672 [Blastosporella zonata]
MPSSTSDVFGSLVEPSERQLQGNDSATGDDLFSSLFSSTREMDAQPIVQPKSRHVRQATAESDSDFGSFVSVSAMEDPLTALDFGLPSQGVASSFLHEPPSTSNSTLTFFDKFTQHAKVASDHSKQGVLDEILKHEDKQLYWLKQDEELQEPTSLPVVDSPDLLDDNTKLSKDGRTPVPNPTEPGSFGDLLDLDHEFFVSKPPLDQPQHRPPHSPSRSSTLALPVIPAPPLADTHNVSYTASPPHSDPRHNTHRSSSYSTLSSFSSRWMSSLLPSKSHSHPHPHNNHGHPSLDSIFSSDSERTSSSPPLHRTSSHPHPHPHLATVDVQISHGTPFGPPSKSKVSPFASHLYVPPTGAPGYKGEQYDWDKGFSSELDSELKIEGAGERELVGVQGKGAILPMPDVGYLMEKKTGGVDLLARRASTTPVLDALLADTIRHHLPALARLPRKWSLIYSLDQHGISLHTLYDRCETAAQVRPGLPGPAGALVVVKDASDGLFGAWMGKEGVHPSRGKGYYGSGDSFLWKYTAGKLKVFKWTGRNDYVALCEPEFISFGGGDGNYGLYLDDTLFEGSSAACPTFANEPLCSGSPRAKTGVVSFECVGLEVWGVGP